MSKQQDLLEELGLSVSFDKSLPDNFLDERKDIYEGGFISTTGSELTESFPSLKDWLKSNSFTESNGGVVYKKKPQSPCKYHEGEIVIFGKKSVQFSLLTKNLLECANILKKGSDSESVAMKIQSGWMLYGEHEIDLIIKSNSDVFRLHLFQFFCKQVRKRGGVRDVNKSVSGLSINPDLLYQSLIGIPVSSLCKRVYEHQSDAATTFRIKISKAYKKALNELIAAEVVVKSESSEGLSLYKPITMEELRGKSKNFQIDFSETYGTSSIS